MAITFEFKIKQLEVAPMLGDLENVVTRVRYDYVGTDENGVTSTFVGATPMPAPNSNAYKPFDQLTEGDVVSWLEEVADKPHMQERITKAIQAQIAPKNVDMPLPWAPVEETPVIDPEL